MQERRVGLRQQRQEGISSEEGPSLEPERPPLVERCAFLLLRSAEASPSIVLMHNSKCVETLNYLL